MKQHEAIGKDPDGFAVFPTPEAGWRAGHTQIKLDQDRGDDLKTFIFQFAPPNENETNEYLEYIAFRMRVEPNIKLNLLSKYALAGLMAKFEGYYGNEI